MRMPPSESYVWDAVGRLMARRRLTDEELAQLLAEAFRDAWQERGQAPSQKWNDLVIEMFRELERERGLVEKYGPVSDAVFARVRALVVGN